MNQFVRISCTYKSGILEGRIILFWIDEMFKSDRINCRVITKANKEVIFPIDGDILNVFSKNNKSVFLLSNGHKLIIEKLNRNE